MNFVRVFMLDESFAGHRARLKMCLTDAPCLRVGSFFSGLGTCEIVVDGFEYVWNAHHLNEPCSVEATPQIIMN